MLAPTDIFFQRLASSRYTYSKEDRAYVCKIEGSRAKSTVKIPASNTSKSLGLSYRYLFLQVRRRAADDFTLTIALRDDRGNRFNFAFSTVMRKSERPSSSQTSAMVHLDIPSNIWVTVVFDLEQVAEQFWRPGAFHQLDSIEIAPFCTLARIFAQDAPPEYGPNGQLVLGRQYCYPAGIESTSVFVPLVTPETELPPRAQTSVPQQEKTVAIRRTPGTQAKRLSNAERQPQPLELTPTRIKTKVAPKPNPRAKPKPKPKAKAVADAVEEEDESDAGAFDGVAPEGDPPAIEIISRLPDNEEDELELVYIESLGCYYCPGNQQYYQIDDQ